MANRTSRSGMHTIGHLWVPVVSTLLLLSAGCPHQTSKPQDTLKAYLLALRQSDHERAYSLLSAELRRRCTMEQFVANVKQMGAKSLKKLDPLLRDPKKMSYRAELGLGGHDKFVLIREKGVWRIATDPLNFYGQSTPRQTLISFVRALQRKRYRILLRFVPNKYRHTMTVADIKKMYSGPRLPRTKRLLRNLKANLDNKFEIKNGKAIMLYGENHQLKMIKEGGIWKIEDFE